MISVICVYNNEKTFRDTLYKSLRIQTVPYDLIAIDNTEGRFASAAQALNYGASKASPDSAFLLFVHQDIEVCLPCFLEDVEVMLASLPSLGIAGVAGNVEGDKNFFSTITHGSPPFIAGRKIKAPFPVMTVDECFVAIPRHIFEQHRFDDKLCDGWHLYAVEYCLRINLAGFKVYVMPASLHHQSTGMLKGDYFVTLAKVLSSYSLSYNKIYTTCGCWNTRIPVLIQMVWFFVEKRFYSAADRLIAWGVVPEWMQRKKRKRLQENTD